MSFTTNSGTLFIHSGTRKQYTVSMASNEVIDLHTAPTVASLQGMACYSTDGTNLVGVGMTSSHSGVHLLDPTNNWAQLDYAQMAGGIGTTYVYDMSSDIGQSEMVFYGLGQNAPPFPQLLPPGSWGIVRYSAWDGAQVGFTVMDQGTARMAVNNSAADSEIVLLTHPDMMIVRLDPYSGVIKSSFNVGSFLPTSNYIWPFNIEIDSGGNLFISYRNSSTSSDIYVFNGVTDDLLAVIPFSDAIYGFCIWGSEYSDYDSIIGIPEIDGILQVTDGVWVNPSGPNSPGAFVSEVAKVAKLLGYTGKALADIIKAANSSDVNK